MWLMPLRSLSSREYELENLPRLILGPIHPNQVIGMDPVGSYHGTWNFRSNSINPTYLYNEKRHRGTDMCPQSKTINQGLDLDPGGDWLGIVPLGWLPTPRIDARGVIWAHIQII